MDPQDAVNCLSESLRSVKLKAVNLLSTIHYIYSILAATKNEEDGEITEGRQGNI